MPKKSFVMVSVLLITYNHEKYIEQSVRSILEQQTTFPIEILIGDDCSTDKTPEILESFSQEPRIHRIPRVKNLGATCNVFDLQKRARGKYIAYLEGDDYWSDPQKLQKQVDFLESHPDFIACVHRCSIVDENGILYSNQHINWIAEKTTYTLKDFRGVVLPGHGSSLLHHNIFIDSGQQYESLITLHPLIGDRSLCLLLGSIGNTHCLSDFMSCYRCPRDKTGENATALAYTKNSNRIRDDYEFTKKLEEYADHVLMIDAGLELHRKDLFVSALWEAIRHPEKSRFSLILQMLREGDSIGYLCYLPAGIARKLQEKHRQGG